MVSNLTQKMSMELNSNYGPGTNRIRTKIKFKKIKGDNESYLFEK